MSQGALHLIFRNVHLLVGHKFLPALEVSRTRSDLRQHSHPCPQSRIVAMSKLQRPGPPSASKDLHGQPEKVELCKSYVAGERWSNWGTAAMGLIWT